MKTGAIETIKKTADELLSLMQVSGTAEVVEETPHVYEVNIEAGETNGLLIGKRGETINSLQYVLGILLRKDLEEEDRVVVNVGDYREKQEDYLKNLAQETAARARETGQEQALYNLTPAQRRIVHMELSEESDVVTESQGEGDDRYLVVKPSAK